MLFLNMLIGSLPLPGHWTTTGQNLGNLKKQENPLENLYRPVKLYKKNLLKPIENYIKAIKTY